jgi:hypothetical protein
VRMRLHLAREVNGNLLKYNNSLMVTIGTIIACICTVEILRLLPESYALA